VDEKEKRRVSGIGQNRYTIIVLGMKDEVERMKSIVEQTPVAITLDVVITFQVGWH